MRILLILVIAFCSVYTFAQDESLPDIRNKRENFNKYPKGEIRDDLAAFTLGGVDERIGKTPLEKLPATDYTSNSITWEGQDIKVIITQNRFEPSKHKLQYYYDKKYLVKIDTKPFYGDYGAVPNNGIASIVVTIGKDTIPIPDFAYSDLFHPEFIYHDESGTVRTRNGVYLSKDKKKIYIYMLNREMVGHYEVTWIIQDKKYVGRVIDSGLLK
jgi:hypothetical protein